MFTVFFNYRGPLLVAILPQDTAITAIYYVQNVLSQVKSAINEQRPKVSTSRTLLLHDNAGPHKDKLAGRKFDRIQALAKAVNSKRRTIPEEDCQGVFRKRQIRPKRTEIPRERGIPCNNTAVNKTNAVPPIRLTLQILHLVCPGQNNWMRDTEAELERQGTIWSGGENAVAQKRVRWRGVIDGLWSSWSGSKEM
ncbi:transposase [Elysia marginata]|uniref:Transposase n=1 Tax=Elysia marginata TaxID=1093978 RepID=A0AAV4GHN1_9GAST|nr:transposase [Elysia marginata]